MSYIDKIESCRKYITKAELLKIENEKLYRQLIEIDEKLKLTDEILYHLPSKRSYSAKLIEEIAYVVVKENYDENIHKAYNFSMPDKLKHFNQHGNDLFLELEEIAILEIDYYSKLNQCYEQELLKHYKSK